MANEGEIVDEKARKRAELDAFIFGDVATKGERVGLSVEARKIVNEDKIRDEKLDKLKKVAYEDLSAWEKTKKQQMERVRKGLLTQVQYDDWLLGEEGQSGFGDVEKLVIGDKRSDWKPVE